jgi:hypothetical protein
MRVTEYPENPQDFMTQESQSEFIYDDNSAFEHDSSEIILESSFIKESSQLSITYTPNDTKYLIITKEELNQVRATAILRKVPLF